MKRIIFVILCIVFASGLTVEGAYRPFRYDNIDHGNSGDIL